MKNFIMARTGLAGALAGARGLEHLGAPRAESPDVATAVKAIENVQRAFEAFKESNDTRIAELEARGSADVLTTEKVDRIDTAVTAAQAAIDELNTRMAAGSLGTGRGGALTAEQIEHADAFNSYFRNGENERNLKALQVKAGLRSGNDTEGGYTAPKEVDNQIDELLRNNSVIRSLATVRSISTKSYTKLVNQGGAASGWVGETEARTETDGPSLSELEFPAMTLYANPAATEELLEDSSIDIGAWLADEVQYAFADQEGDAFVNGDGVKKPTGILGYDAVANGSYTWGKLGYVASGNASSFAGSNPENYLIDLQQSLKQGYQVNATWVTSTGFTTGVRKFKDTAGAYIWQPSLVLGTPATLLGKPHLQDDNLPAIGANAFPAIYGDIRRAYLVVDRSGTRVLRDPLTNKPYVHFYTTKRVGGGVQNFEAIKLFKIASS